MSARTVIVDALDPSGRRGLTVAVRAAFEAGSTDVVPVTAGTWAGEQLRAADARLVASSLAAALEYPTQALLVGHLPNAKVAAAVANAIACNLPETMVFAPGDYVPARTWFAGTDGRQQRVHFLTLVRETTVCLASAAQTASWMASGELGMVEAGERLCAAGAFAAWVRDDSGSVRALDRLVTGDHHAVLDYPALPDDEPDRVPGALAAMLAAGRELQEAVGEAQRLASLPDAALTACR